MLKMLLKVMEEVDYKTVEKNRKNNFENSQIEKK